MAQEARSWIEKLAVVSTRVACLPPVDETHDENYGSRIRRALRVRTGETKGLQFVGVLEVEDINEAYDEAEADRIAWIVAARAKSWEVAHTTRVDGKPVTTAKLVVELVLYDVVKRRQAGKKMALVFELFPPEEGPLERERARKAATRLLGQVEEQFTEKAAEFVTQNAK
jgi:hypothetical protein